MIGRMGLFQDQTDSLSELRRLAALVREPARLDEIGASQWPLAMISFGLSACNDPESFDYSLEIYPRFAAAADLTARQRTLAQLAAFINQRRGDGWRAFVNFALADPDDTLRRNAAFLIATTTPPDEAERFRGVAELLRLLQREPSDSMKNLPPRTPLLSALLGLSDLRFLPLLQSYLISTPCDELAPHIRALDVPPNALSCEWLLRALEEYPTLADDVADALAGMAPKAEAVVDLILPVPAWQFRNPAPQPLHGWTRPEFFARMLPRLEHRVSDDALARVRAAFGA